MIARTALVLAARRAIATEQNIYFKDPYAHLFAVEEHMRFARETDKPVHYVLLRHRLFEDFICTAPKPVEQVLVLGAGFDTKYSRIDALRGVDYIEVDTAETHAHKRAILEKNGLHVPRQHAARIETLDDLGAVLRISDPRKTTMVLAEGFFMYHEEDWVLSALRQIVAYYEARPFLGFDCMEPALAADEVWTKSRKRVESYGEVFRSFITQTRVSAELAEIGLASQAWTPSELKELYAVPGSFSAWGIYALCAYDKALSWSPPRASPPASSAEAPARAGA